MKNLPGTKERAIEDISNMLDRYKGTKREHLLASWLSQYSRYIKQEETFNPKYLKRYKRGEIIKVDLGYRLGSEEGGPHYAVVLDKNNSLYSDIITILPLSSKKETTKINNYVLDLGDEIYERLETKAKLTFAKSVEILESDAPGPVSGQEVILTLDYNKDEIDLIMKEIKSMKEGSIALISQITSISKMRIIKPTRTTDALSGIRLSDNSLNAIDQKISELYLGK